MRYAVIGRLLLFAGLLTGLVDGSAETYRWVGSDGIVHYSDQVPPEEAKHQRAKLNEQGRETAVIEGAKSVEQIRKEQQLRMLRADQERVLREQRDRDMSLLRTYNTEEEMLMALKGKLSTLDTAAKVTNGNKEHQQENLAIQEKRAAEYERKGQAVPQSVVDLIEAGKRQIANYDEKLRNLADERAAIAERFQKDLARFRAIMAQRQQQSSDPPRGGGSVVPNDRGANDGVIISAIHCRSGRQCDLAWGLARTYVSEKTRGSLVIDTERILQTAAPQEDQELALTVTRIAGSRGDDTLFLDVSCRSSVIGEELCRSTQVRALRAEFRPYIEAGLAAGDTPSSVPR